MRFFSGRFALATALALVATPAAAQVVTHVVTTRGWVGVSVTIQTTQDGSGSRTSVTITDVGRGSPADLAGIRTGDVLLSVNGRKSFPQDLHPGDTVHVVIERAGRQRAMTLMAAPRPVEVIDAPTLTVTFRDDSMADRMYLAMDSLRARMAAGAQPGLVEITDVAPFSSLDEVAPGVWTPEEVRPPFGFYIFRGEAHDSLSKAMEALNQDIRRARSQQSTRVRELARNLRGDETRIDRDDPELQRLQRTVVDLDRRAAELREAMVRVARRRPGAAYVGPFSPQTWSEDQPAAERVQPFRPLDPYLLGQNRAAGAEVVDLRPELAEYFRVQGGVLVVDVAEGTPAALAGIQPGDVLTRIGGMPVLSIVELRRGLTLTASEIPVTVVRKGREIQLLLGR
jgi:membrane-associated protease RseP (regulator of RpoE activity)